MSKNIIILFFALFLVSSPGFAIIKQLNTFQGGGMAKIEFAVDTDIMSARKILDDDKTFIKFIPGLRKWKVIKNQPPKQTAECTMSMSNLIPPSNYLVEVTRVSNDELRFKRISGDLKSLEGYWKLEENNKVNSVNVIYYYKIDAGMKHVPQPILKAQLRKHMIEAESRAKRELSKLNSKKK